MIATQENYTMPEDACGPAVARGPHAFGLLHLIMIFTGLTATLLAGSYGAAPLGALILGMAAAVFLPLSVCVATQSLASLFGASGHE